MKSTRKVYKKKFQHRLATKNELAVFSCIKNNDIEKLKIYIASGFNPNTTINGVTLLGTALIAKNYEIAEYICSLRETNINKRFIIDANQTVEENTKTTPIEYAVFFLFYEYLKSNEHNQNLKSLLSILIEKGARTSSTSPFCTEEKFDCFWNYYLTLRTILSKGKTK